jgi:hypothetical protein
MGNWIWINILDKREQGNEATSYTDKSTLFFMPCCLVAFMPCCLAAFMPLCLVAFMPLCLVASLPLCLISTQPALFPASVATTLLYYPRSFFVR